MVQTKLFNKVEKALEEIRPFLVADGGDVSLIGIDDDVVKVKFHGACIGCTINQLTLKNGVEATIKKHAPGIRKVIEVK